MPVRSLNTLSTKFVSPHRTKKNPPPPIDSPTKILFPHPPKVVSSHLIKSLIYLCSQNHSSNSHHLIKKFCLNKIFHSSLPLKAIFKTLFRLLYIYIYIYIYIYLLFILINANYRRYRRYLD